MLPKNLEKVFALRRADMTAPIFGQRVGLSGIHEVFLFGVLIAVRELMGDEGRKPLIVLVRIQTH